MITRKFTDVLMITHRADDEAGGPWTATLSVAAVTAQGTTKEAAIAEVIQQASRAFVGSYDPVVIHHGGQTAVIYRDARYGWTYSVMAKRHAGQSVPVASSGIVRPTMAEVERYARVALAMACLDAAPPEDRDERNLLAIASVIQHDEDRAEWLSGEQEERAIRAIMHEHDWSYRQASVHYVALVGSHSEMDSHMEPIS